MHNKMVHMVAFLLMAVGGLNWLLVGAFDMNLVTMLLGSGMGAKVVYIAVGLATVLELVTHKGRCADCKAA
jgi:uncharacterized membrane protein YuzA (DUF378 family)